MRIPDIIGTNSQDLGLAVEGLNMAAGATVYGPWIDSMEWVRNLAILAQSDQQYDIVIQRRDKSNTQSMDFAIVTGQTATNTNWRSHPSVGSNSLFGYSVRFGIKNSAAVVNTNARLRVQLLGL